MSEIVEQEWFCTDCGRGPRKAGAVWLESHAPSCQGTDDPAQREGPRKYGKLGA
jgi:hypothetical protein